MLMISVDEVMDILEEYAVCTPDEEKSLTQRINQASMFIDNIVTVSKWISVKDKMPEKSGNYLVYGYWGSGKAAIDTADFSVHQGYFSLWDFTVKYWMPLPQKPESE